MYFMLKMGILQAAMTPSHEGLVQKFSLFSFLGEFQVPYVRVHLCFSGTSESCTKHMLDQLGQGQQL